MTPEENKYDLILIDDDPLIRAAWSLSAKARGHRILAISNLFELPEAVNPDTVFYVDYCFQEQGDGLRVIEELRLKGFSKLNLTTGWPMAGKVLPPAVRGVIGKEYPDSLSNPSEWLQPAVRRTDR